MQEIEKRSEGLWKPSPGSVYPALAQLEEEGLVRAQEVGDRRAYVLTDAGRA
jgi:DNA-binding PadR family transcriptional regulator